MFVNTEMMRESIEARKTTLKDVEMKLGMRALSVHEVGDAFEEVLNVDDNGATWAIFPDIPMFKYPEMGAIFLYPMVIYAKLIAKLRPNWKRVNGTNGVCILLLSSMLLLYTILHLIF